MCKYHLKKNVCSLYGSVVNFLLILIVYNLLKFKNWNILNIEKTTIVVRFCGLVAFVTGFVFLKSLVAHYKTR